MSENQMFLKIKELENLENLIEEASKQADEIKSALKNEMDVQAVSELQVGCYLLHYVNVISNRFETSKFKKLYNDLYKAFTTPVSSRRFSITK